MQKIRDQELEAKSEEFVRMTHASYDFDMIK